MASDHFRSLRTLQQVAEGEAYANISKKIKRDFYVNDLLTGCQKVDKEKVIYRDMKELLSKSGVEFQKWISNTKKLTEMSMEGQEYKGERLDISMDEIAKIIDTSWDQDLDSFNYTTRFPSRQANH